MTISSDLQRSLPVSSDQIRVRLRRAVYEVEVRVQTTICSETRCYTHLQAMGSMSQEEEGTTKTTLGFQNIAA